VQTEVLKQFFAGTLEKDADKIPFVIIPRTAFPTVLHLQGTGDDPLRIMAFLGIDIERFDDEMNR
jgi:hypothetical protein